MDWNDRRKCEKRKNLFEEVKVADVEEVKSSRHINYSVTLLWSLTKVPNIYYRLAATSQFENSSSFWVVGRNWERPVQGDRAAAPVLISEEAARSTWSDVDQHKLKRSNQVGLDD